MAREGRPFVPATVDASHSGSMLPQMTNFRLHRMENHDSQFSSEIITEEGFGQLAKHPVKYHVLLNSLQDKIGGYT